MSLQPLSWFRAIQCLPILRNGACFAENHKCQWIFSGLTRTQSTVPKVCTLTFTPPMRLYIIWNRHIVVMLVFSCWVEGSVPARVKAKSMKSIFAGITLEHAAFWCNRTGNNGWLKISIMCVSVKTCLPAECYFSKLALENSIKGVGLM